MEEIHINTDGDDRWWLQKGIWEETSYGKTWKYDQKDELAGLMDDQLIDVLRKLGNDRRIKIDIHWNGSEKKERELHLKKILTAADIHFSS